MMRLRSGEDHFKLGVVMSRAIDEFMEVLGLDGLDLSWHDFANCKGADADLFFPGTGESTEKAKQICGVCRV